MSEEVKGLLIQLEATTAQLRREMTAADRLVDETTRSIDQNLERVDEAFDRTAASVQSAGDLMKGAFAAIVGAGVVSAVVEMVDQYGQMADRISAATQSTAEYDQVQQHLLQTAQETYRPLEEAQELYIRTADVMRGLGYDTQQTLDITDSFSFLLVTNAASAEKASTALDAYTKSLQTGKVEAEGWVSMQTAMPTLAEAIATATGKSTEEIRKLGTTGKLSLDMVNQGLLKTREANRLAAAEMSVSVKDSLTNMQNSLQVFIGKFEESTGTFATISSAIGLLAEHVDILAIALSTRLMWAMKGAVGATLLGIKTWYADVVARQAQANATLQAALADQRKAQTATMAAAAEAQAARGTAVQTAMSLQLAQARMREVAATNAVAAAQTSLNSVRWSTVLPALLGGPMGIAMLATAAATSFLLLRDNAKEASVSLEDMQKPLAQLREEFQKLNRDQKEASIVKWKTEQLAAADEVKAAFSDLGGSLRAAMVTDAGGRSGGLGLLAKDAQEQMSAFAGVMEQLRKARSASEDLAPILQRVGEELKVPAETVQGWLSQAGSISDADARARQIGDTLQSLTGILQESTSATRDQAAAMAGLTDAGKTYLGRLNQQLASLQDNGDAVKEANRYIGDHAELSEADRAAILSSANAIEAQEKANRAATQATKAHGKALQDEIKALDALIDRALPEKKRLADLVEGIEGLRKAQALGKISAAEMEAGIKNLNEAYADGQLQQRIQQEQKLAEARRQSAEAYREAMEVILQARQAAIDSDIAGLGMGDQLRAQAQRLEAVRTKYAEARRALEEQQEDASRRLSEQAYQERLADLAEYQARETQMEADAYEARLAAQRDYRTGARRAWDNIQAEANDHAAAMERTLTAGFNSASDALADFVTTGKLNFRDFASSVINDMARIAAQHAATNFLTTTIGLGMSALGGLFGGTSAGASASDYTGSAFSSWAAAQAKGGAWDSGVQFFAKGGVVGSPTAFGMAGGQMGVMGEAGPEAILPLARGSDGSLGVRAGGSAASTVQISSPVSVQVEDRSGEGMQLDQQALAQNLSGYIQVAAEKAVADSWRPGGVSHRQSVGRG